ncbi:hypothetical protein Tco_0600491 [Tanacetum coccineum]|uniref:Uncharacterized protein n=1 Tax=Tanacetum coccineum TaxID=301880 RepID=A0ABQ4WBV4_9ASTR
MRLHPKKGLNVKTTVASQVDVNKEFGQNSHSTLFCLRTRTAFAKPDHVIASSSSRNSSKNMPRFSSNGMVHNHYLDEARKKTQERDRNSKTNLYRHRFSPNKTSVVYEKTSPRSDLGGNPRVKIFKSVGLRMDFLQESTSINVQKEQSLDLSAVSTEVHQAAETVTTSNELDLLFGPLFDEYFNGENQVVLKSSAVTTTDAQLNVNNKLDSTSSTSL